MSLLGSHLPEQKRSPFPMFPQAGLPQEHRVPQSERVLGASTWLISFDAPRYCGMWGSLAPLYR